MHDKQENMKLAKLMRQYFLKSSHNKQCIFQENVILWIVRSNRHTHQMTEIFQKTKPYVTEILIYNNKRSDHSWLIWKWKKFKYLIVLCFMGINIWSKEKGLTNQ